jgi:hypothetical protein
MGQFSVPRMIYEVICNNYGKVINEGKPKYFENNSAYCHTVLPIPHTDPVVRGEKLTANGLSYLHVIHCTIETRWIFTSLCPVCAGEWPYFFLF